MVSFRVATPSELTEILDWAGDEGWNPGLDDAEAFYAADREGFFVAVEGGRPVASISVVNHSDRFAFLGLYIATPSARGRGVGYGLWQHAIRHAGARTIGLDGVPEQQANYEASGFKSAGGTTRFSGQVEPGTGRATLVGPGDIPGLIDREAGASGVRKEAYLSAWFSNTAQRRTIALDQAFCTVRRCRDGVKIGPLIAGSRRAALDLIREAGAVFGPDLIIDVPSRSAELEQVCRDLGFSAGFETARMYRGAPPEADPSIFAVTSLELG